MGLRLWFPFSKDDPTYNMGSHSRSIALYYTIIENFMGIDFPAITQENITINASGGKTSAKCANFASNSCLIVPAGGLNDAILFKDIKAYNSFIPMFWPERKNFSIAFWMKSDNNGTMCFFCGRRETGKGISLFKIGSTFRFDAGEQTTFSCASTYPDWTHFCFTWDGKVKRFYINGVENSDSPQACTANVTHYAPTIRIGNSASNTSDDNPAVTNQFTGKMNDYRFYDHCLSPREVKLLAQGLIAHYKMSGIHMDNLIPGGGFAGTNSWTGGKIDWSVSAAGDVASLKLDKGTNVASTPIAVQPILGHKYYGRELIKTNGNVSATDCRFELFAGDGPGLNWVFGYNSGNYRDWTINSGIITVDELNGTNYIIRSFVVNSTNTVWIDDVVLIDLTVAFGKGNEPSKEWCDQNIPWHHSFGVYNFIPNTTDSSGYNNNLNISSQAIGGTSSAGHALLSNCLSADSIKYRNCTKFNVLENKFFTYNTRSDSFPDSITNGTISGWIKLNTYPSSDTVVFADYHSDIAFGFWGEQNAIIRCSNKENATRTIINLKSKWDINKWHHIAVTRDNNTFTFYLDGQEWSSIGGAYDNTSPNYWTHNYGALTLGARHTGSSVGNTAKFELPFSGLMSDIRVYVTPLTAAAVKEFYQSSISLLDNGTLQCSEIVENNTNLKYNQNGIVQANTINEIGYTEKMKIKILPDGSAWARIHWLDVSADPLNKALYFTDEKEVAYCVDKSNRFSLMGLVDHFYRSRYELTNLMPTILKNNYTGGIYDETVLNENQESFKVVGGSGGECFLRTAKQNIQFKSGHVYYACAEIYQTQPNGSSDFYFIEEEPSWYAGKTVSAANTWTRISSVFSSTKWGDRTTGIRLDYNNLGQSIPMWFSKMMLIDLTEDFGQGNEPSCEWCDKNIPYFTTWESIEVYDENNKGDCEFMLTYPKISSTEYNRWFQNSSPNSAYVGGLMSMDDAWPEHNYGIRKHYSGSSIYDCSYDGYWYAPIGQLSPWDTSTSRAIPAANGNSTTETELWVRIDNLSTLQKISMLDKSIQGYQIYEL